MKSVAPIVVDAAFLFFFLLLLLFKTVDIILVAHLWRLMTVSKIQDTSNHRDLFSLGVKPSVLRSLLLFGIFFISERYSIFHEISFPYILSL